MPENGATCGGENNKMKKVYQINSKQLVLLAFATAIFAAGAVLVYERVGLNLLGRLVGAEPAGFSENAQIQGLTDPSVASDEKNNQEVYNAISPGVVNITSTVLQENWFMPEVSQGTGSGAILNKQGEILTNYHVIADATKLEVLLAGGKTYKATMIGADEDNDLALIKINAPAAELTPVPLGSSKDLFVGQKVLAIGNPFGFKQTLTRGIISGLERPIRSEMTGKIIEGVVQTDAAINPGNSGGPLLNSRGQMIGINTLIYSPTGGSVGLGFAVPVDTAKKVITDIQRYGHVRKAQLGIRTFPVGLNESISRTLRLPVNSGLLIEEVYPGTPAAKAGIRGGNEQVRINRGYVANLGGDIIVGIDGKPINDRDDLDRILGSKQPGDSVNVEFYRGNRKQTVIVQLAELR